MTHYTTLPFKNRITLANMLIPLILALAALTVSCPTNPPTTSTSKGFYLSVKLTNPANDLPIPVTNTYLASIRVGAGLALVGSTPDTSTARTFYVDGTDQQDSSNWTTLSDGATPPVPFGLSLVPDPLNKYVRTAHLDAGNGHAGIYVADGPELAPLNWMACDEPLEYYQGRHFNIFKQRYYAEVPVPDECVEVKLLPECTELEELPEVSIASHEYAREIQCYKGARTQ
jgi:hypothetical protein